MSHRTIQDLFPSDGQSFSAALLQSPLCLIYALKFESLNKGNLTTKTNLLNVGVCHVKISAPQQLRATAAMEIFLLLFNTIKQPQFTHQRVQGLHTIEICAWTAGSLDLPGFSPSAAAAQLPTGEQNQPYHSPAAICTGDTRV